MKRNVILGLLIIIAGAIFAMSCNSTSNNSAGEDYTKPDALKALIESKDAQYILIDVRTKEEFDAGHIPGSINIPYDVISRNLPTTNKDAEIILYCRSGRRSGIAQKTLQGLGYTKVTDFGGVSNWKWSLE